MHRSKGPKTVSASYNSPPVSLPLSAAGHPNGSNYNGSQQAYVPYGGSPDLQAMRYNNPEEILRPVEIYTEGAPQPSDALNHPPRIIGNQY
jgi:hypothetical protein